jgi:Inner membrane protein YgaP-like, transmembrane domain
MSLLDRKLRGFAATPLLPIAALLVGVGTAAGIVLLALAAVMAVTSLVGFCPLYALTHINTRGAKPLPH